MEQIQIKKKKHYSELPEIEDLPDIKTDVVEAATAFLLRVTEYVAE